MGTYVAGVIGFQVIRDCTSQLVSTVSFTDLYDTAVRPTWCLLVFCRRHASCYSLIIYHTVMKDFLEVS